MAPFPSSTSPPLYPAVLAAASSFGTSIVTSARWLNALLFGANILVFELLIRRFSRSARLVPMAAAVLLVAGPASGFDLLSIHAAVLSEPLFLFVFLLGILMVDKYLDDPRRGTLVCIGICVASAPLIRFAGFSLVLGAAIVLLLWAPFTRSRRERTALGVVAAGVIPSVLWSLYVSGLLHGGSARDVTWHPESGILRAIVDVASAWILPRSLAEDAQQWMFLSLLVTVGVLLFVQRRRSTEDARRVNHVVALVVFAGAYLAVVIVARDFLDAILGMNDRILSPLIPLLYVIVIAAIVGAFRYSTKGSWITAGLCLLAAIAPIGPWITVIHHPPAPTGGVADSPTMQAIRRLPSGTVIASSVPDLLFTDAARSSIRLPALTDPLTQRANRSFEHDLQQLATRLIHSRGIIVAIPKTRLEALPDSAWAANFRPFAHVDVVRTFRDGGTFYRLRAVADPSSAG